MKRQATRLIRSARRHWGWSAALAAAGVLAVAGLARVLAPPHLSSATEFPRVNPARLAHLLADVSAHTLPLLGSWSLEDEAGNYTSWRYTVAYECGPRCAGRVSVHAHDEHAAAGAGGAGAGAPPRHGLAAAAHRVLVLHVLCTKPLFLPFIQICDETETESVVTATSTGARLQESSRASCGVAAAVLARCTTARGLRAAADARLLRLRELVAGGGAGAGGRGVARHARSLDHHRYS